VDNLLNHGFLQTKPAPQECEKKAISIFIAAKISNKLPCCEAVEHYLYYDMGKD